MSRQIDRLEIRVARLRRGIKDIHTNFSNIAKPIENKPVPEDTPAPAANSELSVFVTETDPEGIAAYRREFPNHKIVRLPADDAAAVPVARRGGYSFERKINGGPLLT